MSTSLDNSFTIQVGGSSIAAPSSSADEQHQAKVGDSQPAVFSLQNGRLQSGDWVLGRARAEDRSFAPKKVFWFKASDCEGKVQTVSSKQEGDATRLFFENASLIVEEGNVLADLNGETHEQVSINTK